MSTSPGCQQVQGYESVSLQSYQVKKSDRYVLTKSIRLVPATLLSEHNPQAQRHLINSFPQEQMDPAEHQEAFGDKLGKF